MSLDWIPGWSSRVYVPLCSYNLGTVLRVPSVHSSDILSVYYGKCNECRTNITSLDICNHPLLVSHAVVNLYDFLFDSVVVQICNLRL